MFVHQALRKLARENNVSVNSVRKAFKAHLTSGAPDGMSLSTKDALKAIKNTFKVVAEVTK